ncbi:MAG: winged helix-turn-helix domain-containing protein [Sedimenticola sp.]
MVNGSSPYRMGDWVIDPRQGSASRRDERVHLEPKAIELLNYLASRPGEVVSRAELLEAVWPGVIVSDEVITNAIAKLRRALGDEPKSPRIIETIPKRGYRILVPVTEALNQNARGKSLPPGLIAIVAAAAVLAVVGALLVTWYGGTGSDTAPTGHKSLPLPERPSIAVLPFVNLSDDKGQEYFVDGMTEDLITDLSRVSGLFVIARNSSFAYKGREVDLITVGRELGVRFIIEGSVRKLGDKLRINVQLLDAVSGGHLWAERFDSELNEVFSVQDRMAARVITALSVKMTSMEESYSNFQETYNPAAYQAFLKGWAAYQRDTPEDFASAIAHLEAAVKIDPAYGRALATLAAIYWDTYQKRWYRRLDISPISLSWQRANEYLEKSMVAPSPLAHKIRSSMLITNSRFDEAIKEARRAIAIDPNDPLGYVALAEALIFIGSPEEAESLVTRAMRLDPQNPVPYLSVLGKAQLVKGSLGEAISSLEEATRNSTENRLAWMALISAYGATSQTEKAKAALGVLDDLQRRDKLVSFTIANAREHWPFKVDGDRERFLDGLRKAGVSEW